MEKEFLIFFWKIIPTFVLKEKKKLTYKVNSKSESSTNIC